VYLPRAVSYYTAFRLLTATLLEEDELTDKRAASKQ
jgi:hypothetical protein